MITPKLKENVSHVTQRNVKLVPDTQTTVPNVNLGEPTKLQNVHVHSVNMKLLTENVTIVLTNVKLARKMLMTVLYVLVSESTNQNVTAQMLISKTRTKLVKNAIINVLNAKIPEPTVPNVTKKDRNRSQLVNVNMENTKLQKNVTIVITNVNTVKHIPTNVLNVLTTPEKLTTNVIVKQVSITSEKLNVNHVMLNVPNVRTITNVPNVTLPELKTPTHLAHVKKTNTLIRTGNVKIVHTNA